jgi:hypothetical protein
MMGTLLENLLREAKTSEIEQGLFCAVAKYYPEMDFMLYLNEDCSYRADRVDQFLTILFHPDSEKVVGIKLKGFKFLFERLKNVIGTLDDDHFLPLVKILEFALVGGVAEEIAAKHRGRIKDSYEKAKKVAADVQFNPQEIGLLEAA